MQAVDFVRAAKAERDALPKEVRYVYRLEGVVKSDVPFGTEIYL
jgi:hypothetical protein